jgi:hypothetical protein
LSQALTTRLHYYEDVFGEGRDTDVIRPVKRVWFANDASDRRHRRWAEGALNAAVKNAYAIHTDVRGEMPWED